MQKKTRSLLEELDSMYIERDRRLVLENRARNVIETAIRLIESIEQEYEPEQADNITRKMFNAIRNRDIDKFTRSVRRTNADQ